jgi:hypothetical protein
MLAGFLTVARSVMMNQSAFVITLVVLPSPASRTTSTLVSDLATLLLVERKEAIGQHKLGSDIFFL